MIWEPLERSEIMNKLDAIIITMILLVNVSVVRAEILPALDLERNSSSYAGTGNYRTSGWEFSVTDDLAVVGLGVFDLEEGLYTPGLMVPHDIGIWHSGELVLSAIVPAGTEGVLIDQFRYVETDPFWLTAGETYVIGATLIGDPFVGNDNLSRITMIPSVTYERTLISPSDSGFTLPTTEAEYYRLGPNFLVIPEPVTILLLGAGGLLVGMRANRRSR
jgi:hypothetical protein